MTANHAWMLKGWLLAEHAPTAIMEAVERVIESLTAVPVPPVGAEITRDVDQPEPEPDEHDEEHSEPKPEKKRRAWSPEARAAAADRMKARQAAGLMAKRKPGDTPPGEANALR